MDTEGERGSGTLNARTSTLGSMTRRWDLELAFALTECNWQTLTLPSFCIFTWEGERISLWGWCDDGYHKAEIL